MTPTYDLAVVGAGSGGIGAALAAARAGLHVLLLEAAAAPGGTSTRGGVHAWETTAGATGIPFDIYRAMRSIPLGTGILSIRRHCCFAPPLNDYPGGENIVDPARGYHDTLQRCGTRGLSADEARCRKQLHAVVFEPAALVQAVCRLLAQTGRCEIRWNAAVRDVSLHRQQVQSVSLQDGTRITAHHWVDATGDAELCRFAGAAMMQGMDPRSRFNEPGAPEQPLDTLNGVTRLYRITPAPHPRMEPLPHGVPETCWWRESFPYMACNQYPNGDWNCNMLPTMEGRDYITRDPADALHETERRVRAHWHFIQAGWPEFQRYRLHSLSPAIGVRETERVETEYVLTEHDILQGLAGQQHPDIVAITDHPRDRHGASGGIHGELSSPYGIPYRCLIPKGFRNLLVACRGAGFSSIAASSCRLSRAMIQLGQAAGTAAALAHRTRTDLPDVPADALRADLRAQHVQLDWPLPDAMKTYLMEHETVDG